MSTRFSKITYLITGVSVAFATFGLLRYYTKPKRKHRRPIRSNPSNPLMEHDEDDAEYQESQNLLNLLYSIAEDQSRKDGFIHRGITCNNCGTSPIRGLRFKCSNCVDYDLCEACEAQECHHKTHVFLKIRIPIPPLANPRSALLNVFYPGKFDIASSLPYELSRDLQKKTHFDQVELEALFDQFKSLATAEGEGIVKSVFEQCLGPLGMEKNLITERIFKFFDQNEDNVIDFTEFVSGLSILCKGNLEEKMIHAFRGYDLDGDGLIKRDELRKVISAYFHLSTELVRDVVKAMDEEMMESFEFLPGQPVSAAFTAPIPTDELPSNYSKNNEMLPTPDEDDEKWPVMEAMSQDAMDEMIDKAFSFESTSKEFISFEEFRKLVENDSRLIAWFEALGSVF